MPSWSHDFLSPLNWQGSNQWPYGEKLQILLLTSPASHHLPLFDSKNDTWVLEDCFSGSWNHCLRILVHSRREESGCFILSWARHSNPSDCLQVSAKPGPPLSRGWAPGFPGSLNSPPSPSLLDTHGPWMTWPILHGSTASAGLTLHSYHSP